MLLQKNWFTGIGFSYQRRYFNTIKKVENENHFDLILNTRYNFRTVKKTSHFVELMYIGGERSVFLVDTIITSKMPYVSKVRISYGFHFQPKKHKNFGWGVKINRTYHLSTKNIYQSYTSPNLYLNYYFKRKNGSYKF